MGAPITVLEIGSIRVTVPARPFVTHTPSGLTATSTASVPIGIRRPLPGTSGSSRVTVLSPASAVHTEPAPTATRSGAGPGEGATGWVSLAPAAGGGPGGGGARLILLPPRREREHAVVAPAGDPPRRAADRDVGRQPPD